MRRILSLITAAALVCTMAGCGGQSTNEPGTTVGNTGTTESKTVADTTVQTDEIVSITYFGVNANAGSGELAGGLGKFFEDRGLSIEVVPYSTEKLQAQLASGALADVIWLPQQEMLVAAESGLILPLDDYLDQMPAIVEHADLYEPAFSYAREYNSNDTGKVYYIGQVGPSAMNVVADTERFAIKMNWNVYAQANYPEFSSLEDVIPVLKTMQELYPETENGIATYGMNLFSDFDTDHFWNINSVYCLLGKVDSYLGYGVEYDVRTQTGTSMFADGSTYYRALKFMYEMNQAGLVDPDSLSQTRSTAWEKIHDGAALAGWAGNPGWESDGYYPVLFDEFVPTYSTASAYPVGGYCISSTCKNVDAALKFLNILSDDEDLLVLWGGYPGEDRRWNYDADGTPTITETYAKAMEAGEDITLPAEESIDFWNITYLLSKGCILDFGTSYDYTNFPSYHEYRYSVDMAKDWTKLYGYTYLRELIEDKSWPTAIQTEGFTSFLTADSDSMIMTKAALRDIIVPASWRMVFASSEEEFDSIWNETKRQCESLGIDEVIQYKLDDIANARATWASIN